MPTGHASWNEPSSHASTRRQERAVPDRPARRAQGRSPPRRTSRMTLRSEALTRQAGRSRLRGPAPSRRIPACATKAPDTDSPQPSPIVCRNRCILFRKPRRARWVVPAHVVRAATRPASFARSYARFSPILEPTRHTGEIPRSGTASFDGGKAHECRSEA